MIGLDTNILIRFLIKDDIKQANKVLKLFETADKQNQSFFISNFTVIETVWVLSKLYKTSNEDILTAFDILLSISIINFESENLLKEFIKRAEKSKLDLPDLLIGLSAVYNNCYETITFDKKAAKTDLFKLLK